MTTAYNAVCRCVCISLELSHTKTLIDAWYQNKAEKVFQERFAEQLKKFEYKEAPRLSLKKMDKRWGSFLKGPRVILNTRLIAASKECIDYVITHELCHMRYKDHSKKFFDYLEMKMPNWEKVKDRLERTLA